MTGETKESTALRVSNELCTIMTFDTWARIFGELADRGSTVLPSFRGHFSKLRAESRLLAHDAFQGHYLPHR
jgi:hypothetical protein